MVKTKTRKQIKKIKQKNRYSNNSRKIKGGIHFYGNEYILSKRLHNYSTSNNKKINPKIQDRLKRLEELEELDNAENQIVENQSWTDWANTKLGRAANQIRRVSVAKNLYPSQLQIFKSNQLKMLLKDNLRKIIISNSYDTDQLNQLTALTSQIKINPSVLNEPYLDNNDNTIVHLATISNCFKCLEFLINMEASVNVKNQNGDTPAHLAAKNIIMYEVSEPGAAKKGIECLKMLFNKDKNILNKNGIQNNAGETVDSILEQSKSDEVNQMIDERDERDDAPKQVIAKFIHRNRFKIRAKYLSSICSDSGVCIAFGESDNKIKQLFDGFTNFKYVNGNIIKIGADSTNGFVYEIPYEREGYKAHTILKSSAKSNGDNLLYEYSVGQYLNKLCKLVPSFLETYGLFKYKSANEWTIMKTNLRNSSISKAVFEQSLNEISNPTTDYTAKQTIRTSCTSSKLMAILIQHLSGVKTLGDMLSSFNKNIGNSNNFIKFQLPLILYQVYYSLSLFGDTFTHNDLHDNNVLLYVPNATKYITYHYHNRDKTTTTFNSHYLVKIIDYGVSYFEDKTSQNQMSSSLKIFKIVNNENLCSINNKISFGYEALRLTGNSCAYPIYVCAQKNNPSNDLRLLHILKNYSRLLTQNNDLTTLIANVHFEQKFGTPYIDHLTKAQKNLNADIIVDVHEAYAALQLLVNSNNFLTDNNAIYSGNAQWSKYGDLHVYSNGQPMNFIPFIPPKIPTP